MPRKKWFVTGVVIVLALLSAYFFIPESHVSLVHKTAEQEVASRLSNEETQSSDEKIAIQKLDPVSSENGNAQVRTKVIKKAALLDSLENIEDLIEQAMKELSNGETTLAISIGKSLKSCALYSMGESGRLAQQNLANKNPSLNSVVKPWHELEAYCMDTPTKTLYKSVDLLELAAEAGSIEAMLEFSNLPPHYFYEHSDRKEKQDKMKGFLNTAKELGSTDSFMALAQCSLSISCSGGAPDMDGFITNIYVANELNDGAYQDLIYAFSAQKSAQELIDIEFLAKKQLEAFLERPQITLIE